MVYTGEGCSATNTSQPSNKYSCDNFNGGPNGASSVYITATEKADGSGKIYFTGNVGINGTFTASSANANATEFKSKTYFNIYSSQGGSLLQQVNMHTSCSAPVAAGDQIGSMFLLSATFKNGVDCGPAIPPGPPEECPVPVVTINSSQGNNNTNVCAGEAITFVTSEPDCNEVTLTWNFGAGANPQTATGKGPHFVTYSNTGTATVTLTADNNCSGGTGTTVCPPPPPPAIGSDCCDSNSGKPKKLTVEYTGISCGSTNTSQQPNKYECTDFNGGPNGDQNVYITVTEKEDGSGKLYFAGNVGINTTFTPDAGNAGDNTFKSKVFFRIFSSQGGSLRQIVNMHTSCSAPLVPGENIGSILLESSEWADGSFCDVSGGGNSGGGSGGADCCDSNSGKPVALTMEYTGEGCSATNTSQQPNKYSCDNFSGGPNGDQSVYIVAAEKEDGSGKIYFSGNVGINTTFSPSAANAGDNQFKSKIFFRIFSSQGGTLRQIVNMHTSCSAPLVPGDQIGSLILMSAEWANGAVCGQVTPPGPDCLDCHETVSVPITIMDCDCINNGGDSDGDGICNDDDCAPFNPNLPTTPGTACNDGDPNTTNDVIQADGCTCAGTGGNNLAKLGDRVWFDANSNGTQDNGEQGIPNAFVMLKTCADAFVAFTFTDANGMYMFNDLQPGCYRVFFANPDGSQFMPTLVNVGNDAFDNDAGLDGLTSDVNLAAGETNLTIDAGYKPIGGPVLGSIGDFVWLDLDGDGFQDPNEPGVPDVPVQLKDCNNNVLQTTTTDGNGGYSFGGLNAGCYRIGVTLPSGFQFSPANQSGDNTDSDINPAMSMTGDIDLAQGENDPSNDAGIVPGTPQLGSLGDFVWNDMDQDGFQDPNEPGVAGVTVQLKDCSNNVLQTTTTNGNGGYSFNNLNAGCYRIGVVLPTGFQFSPANQAGDAVDSDINPAMAMTGDINLGQGEDDPTNDAGIFQPAPQLGSLGDFVWNDMDQDGFQDPNEPGVSGVTVQLKDCSNNVLQTTITNGNGGYSFNNLNAGCYRIGVVLPTGFQFSPANQAGDAVDSDINPAMAMTGDINLGQGEDDPTNDAGIFQPAPQLGSLGDFVWNDMDEDGFQDPNEPGVAGVTVQLKNCSNVVMQTTTTSSTGFYSFDNLNAGCYRIGVVLPTGFQFSPANQAGDASDSDINPGTAMTGDINLGQGEDDPTNDAGIFGTNPGDPCAAISISVSAGQITVSGQDAPIVTIQVFDSSWNTIFTCGANSTCSDPTNVSVDAGEYCVKVQLFTANWQPICEVFECVTVPPGGGNPGSIGDKVFNDLDQDGIQDPNEPGIGGVTVQLKNCSNVVIATTTTNGSGNYLFSNLDAGCYRVGVVLPGGFMFTNQNVGNDALDSDINPANGMTGDINLAQGENDPTNDAGLVSQTGQCDNITFGGKIGFGATCAGSVEICDANGGFGPTIGNCISPSGGSGAMEIIWLRNSVDCNPIGVTIEELLNNPGSSPWEIVPGANSLTFDPGFVGTTTCFQRCVRRAGCTIYTGESNLVQISVNPNCGGNGAPDCSNVSISAGSGVINISGLNGAPITSAQVFSATWSVLFSCYSDCGGNSVSVPVGSGLYHVKVKYADANWAPICEVNQDVNVSSNLIFSGQFEFEAVGYLEHTELVWVHNRGDEVVEYVLERSLDGNEFDVFAEQESKGTAFTEVYADYDLSPATGDNYYRIKMEMRDGSFTYSEVKKVNFIDVIDFALFPNPANDFVNVNLETVVGQKDVTISVFNNLGVTVQQFELDEVYSKYYQMDIRELKEGHYIVWLNVPGHKPLAKQLVVAKI